MLNNPLFTLSSQNTKLCDTTGISRKFPKVIFWLVLSLIWLPSDVFAQSECSSVIVKIQNIGNSTGVIACAVFESGEGFPDKSLKFASKVMLTQIRGKDVSFKFSDIEPGKYAFSMIHDENRNGKLDTDF